MRTKKQVMSTIRTKSLNYVMRNTPFGVTHMNEIPSKESNLSTTTSHSNFTDDVYIPVVVDLAIMWSLH